MSQTPRLRIIFAGTPAFAATHLESLLASSQHDIVAVYTQPDRPAKRGKKVTESPVKVVATAHQLPIFQPQTLKDEAAQEQLQALNADLMIVVAYGLILPQAVLDAPRLGCINVHASILPRWRGAAPIERAIEAGDAESGVTIMQMDIGLDTGDMLLISRCPITADETAATLHDKLAELGPPALQEVLTQLAEGHAVATPQEEAAVTYASKIDKADLPIDWSLSAAVLDRKIRAFHSRGPYILSQGERVKIQRAEPRAGEGSAGTVLSCNREGIEVACGEGSLLITELQLPGGKAMAVAAMLNAPANAARFAEGVQLEQLS